MGLFDEVTKNIGGGDLLSSVMGMLGDQSRGGLGGLVQSFTDNGLGSIVSSWVSTGKNEPISPDQVAKGLGGEQVQKLADSTGLSLGDVTSKLSELLPNVVDKLTPEGKIPDGNILDQGLDMLKGLF